MTLTLSVLVMCFPVAEGNILLSLSSAMKINTWLISRSDVSFLIVKSLAKNMQPVEFFDNIHSDYDGRTVCLVGNVSFLSHYNSQVEVIPVLCWIHAGMRTWSIQ